MRNHRDRRGTDSAHTTTTGPIVRPPPDHVENETFARDCHHGDSSGKCLVGSTSENVDPLTGMCSARSARSRPESSCCCENCASGPHASASPSGFPCGERFHRQQLAAMHLCQQKEHMNGQVGQCAIAPLVCVPTAINLPTIHGTPLGVPGSPGRRRFQSVLFLFWLSLSFQVQR